MTSNQIKSIVKIIVFVAFLVILYNECLIYYSSYFSWPEHHIKRSSSLNENEREVRLLLVADPQLIGEEDEPWHYSWIARWDSDRYLHNTYMLAHSYVKPDVVVFMGDLFDEGLKASDEQYDRYFTRFKRIFRLGSSANALKDGMSVSAHDRTRYVFMSGDNDVGGEYMGDRNDKLGDRFEKYFGSMMNLLDLNDYLRIAKLDLDYTVSFYNSMKRNAMRELIAELDGKRSELESENRNKYLLIFNHMTLLRRDNQELEYIQNDLKSNIVIKGDSHTFYVANYNYKSHKIESSYRYKDNPSNYYIFQLKPTRLVDKSQGFTEISIPTCSYRMGVPDMGYGMLTIAPNGKVYLSILWLPSRFSALYNYLYVILFMSLFFMFKIVFKRVYFKFYRRFYRLLYKN